MSEPKAVELVGWIVSECPHCREKEVVCWPIEGSPQGMRCSSCGVVFEVPEYFEWTITLPPARREGYLTNEDIANACPYQAEFGECIYPRCDLRCKGRLR